MDIVILQNEVRDLIKTVLDDAAAEVIEMPENDNDFNRPKTTKGKVVVGYQQSDFSDTVIMNGVAQIEKPLIILTLQSRTLYGANGIYTLFKKIKSVVIGFRPTDCDRPFVAKYFGPPESYTKPKIEDVWTYEYHIETRCPSVQEPIVDDIIAGASPLPISATLVIPTTGAIADEYNLQGPSALITLVEG